MTTSEKAALRYNGEAGTSSEYSEYSELFNYQNRAPLIFILIYALDGVGLGHWPPITCFHTM